MKDSIANITKWILFLLLALVFVSGLLFYLDILTADLFINWSKLLLIVGVAIMVISPIYGFILHPKNAVKLLISLALFVVVIIIGYSLAGNEFSELRLEELKATAETSKLVGMGLYVTYIAFGLAILAAIYTSIIKVFK
jgi:hypothetical protein